MAPTLCGGLLRSTATALLLLSACSSDAGPNSDTSNSSTAASTISATNTCPITATPTPILPTAITMSGGSSWVGSGDLYVSAGFVQPDATQIADGTFPMKLGWWRLVPGEIIVEAVRVDGPGDLEPYVLPDGGSKSTGPLPSSIALPSLGCWTVTGHLGTSSASTTFLTTS